MFRPMRPVAVRRPVGAPLLRGALAAEAAQSGVVGSLTRLAEMAQQGLLTPEEFAAAKARLLGPGD
jgi:hypothetical protein